MGRFRSRIDLVQQTYRMCTQGGMPEPRWLAPLKRFQESALEAWQLDNPTSKKRRQKIRRIHFPEDRFHQSYLDRHPQARRQPVDLSSFDPPLARRFAWEQLDLVNQGWSPRQARAQLEERYPPAEMGAVKQLSLIDSVQREEELLLLEAMEQLRFQQQELPSLMPRRPLQHADALSSESEKQHVRRQEAQALSSSSNRPRGGQSRRSNARMQGKTPPGGQEGSVNVPFRDQTSRGADV